MTSKSARPYKKHVSQTFSSLSWKKETTIIAVFAPPSHSWMTWVFLCKPAWTLIHYLADVNGLCRVACLYQEFVSQNCIIRTIFIVVVSDLPSFPVAVKCILKSWKVKGGKGKTEQAGEQSLLQTNFRSRKNNYAFPQLNEDENYRPAASWIWGSTPSVYRKYQLHVQYFAQRKAGEPKKCKREAPGVFPGCADQQSWASKVQMHCALA